MTIFVTGAAGFIGSHVSHVLLDRGETVVGIDNLNAYYDPKLKEARLARLTQNWLSFVKADIADTPTIQALFAEHKPDAVVHLAAPAGVRYKLENPHAYIESNIIGHLNIIEGCRATPHLKNLVLCVVVDRFMAATPNSLFRFPIRWIRRCKLCRD